MATHLRSPRTSTGKCSLNRAAPWMLRSRSRYRELLACEEGIATDVLADRLKRLEQKGLIRKEQDQQDARQYVYKTRLAASVVPMLIKMTVWGARNGKDTSVDRNLLRCFDNDR